MQTTQINHRSGQFKVHKTKYSQEEKRKEYLQKQKNARRDLANKTRKIEFDPHVSKSPSVFEYDGIIFDEEARELEGMADTPPDVETEIESPVKEYHSDEREASIAMPEWMLEIPGDLNSARRLRDESSERLPIKMSEDAETFAETKFEDEPEGWLVIPRPEGTRCVIASSNRGNLVVCRLPSGKVIDSFNSALPKECVLDCIFNDDTKTYFVIDVLLWRGQSMLETTCEFRFFWIHMRLPEEPIGAVTRKNDYAIQPLPFFNCDYDGIRQAYELETTFPKDGLLFYHKFGYYQVGLSPLVILWKDTRTSRYLRVEDPQTATLVAARVEDGTRLGGLANGGFSAGSSTEQEAVMMMGGRFAGRNGEISASSGSSKMDPAAFRISFGGSKQRGGVDIWSAVPGGAAAGPSDGVAGGNACQTSPSLFPSTYTSSAQVPFLQPHQQAPSLFGGMQIQSSQQHVSTLFGGPQKGVNAPALTAPFATTTPFAGAPHSSPSIFAPLQHSTASGPSSLFPAPPTLLTHQTFDTTSRPQLGVFSFAAPLQPPSHLQGASATPAGSSTGDSAATSTSRKANGAICGGGAGSDDGCIDLCTGDGFPLGRLSGAQVKRSGIKAGDLVRCKIWGPGYGAGGPPCAVREAGDALSEPAGVYMSAMAFPAAESQTASASAFSSDLPRGSSLGGEVEGGVAMEDSSSVGVGECGAELGSRLLQGSALRDSDATGGGGGTDTAGGIPLVANLMVEKKLSAAASKMADPWSKIMFHAMLAVRPVTIDDILESVSS